MRVGFTKPGIQWETVFKAEKELNKYQIFCSSRLAAFSCAIMPPQKQEMVAKTTQCEEASTSDITGNAQTKRCKHGGATVGSRNKKKKKKVTKLRGSRKSMESEFQDSSQCHHSLVVSWLGPPQ